MMIYVALSGQHDNVGDTLHRRVLLDFLRPLGELHVHVGSAPKSFQSGLGLDGNERLYDSSAKWASSAFRRAGRDTMLVFSPGEMRLGISRAHRELALMPLAARVKRMGGMVARIGIAVNGETGFEGRFAERAIRSAVAGSDILAWRENESRRVFGHGRVIPDLGFGVAGAGMSLDLRERRALVVTMRFDRPLPPRHWLHGLRRFGDSHGLEVVVTSQVRRDNERSNKLAQILGARFDAWPDERSHGRQEEHLRSLYKQSALVVSDRLHALILGATEGAAASAFSSSQSRKIPTHFVPLGLDIDNPKVDSSIQEIEAHLESALEGRDRQLDSTRHAFGRLSTEIPEMISDSSHLRV